MPQSSVPSLSVDVAQILRTCDRFRSCSFYTCVIANSIDRLFAVHFALPAATNSDDPQTIVRRIAFRCELTWNALIDEFSERLTETLAELPFIDDGARNFVSHTLDIIIPQTIATCLADQGQRASLDVLVNDKNSQSPLNYDSRKLYKQLFREVARSAWLSRVATRQLSKYFQIASSRGVNARGAQLDAFSEAAYRFLRVSTEVGAEHFDEYFTRIVDHCCIDQHRMAKNELSLDHLPESDVPAIDCSGSGFAEECFSGLLASPEYEAFLNATLSRREKQLYDLVYRSGLALSEAAVHLSLDGGYVRHINTRIKSKLESHRARLSRIRDDYDY